MRAVTMPEHPCNGILLAHARFTGAKPWISFNPNYKNIHVEAELNRFSYCSTIFKEMVSLRRAYAVLVYGAYIPVDCEVESAFHFASVSGKKKKC
ncbi:MAG: hypothetical protein U5K54_24180 [Cytophagales bacterium]|nr:hypothetical protein [Cytophagales bacterium]